MDKKDQTSLEGAIRDGAESEISAITRKEAQEIKGLDDAYAAELEDFRIKTTDGTDAKIRQESSRMESRAGLDLKKFKLKSVEAFINRMVEEAVLEIRNNPRYKRFLLDAVVDAVRRIPAGVEVRLAGEDLALEKEIQETLAAAGENRTITIIKDKTIRWGGCIVVDVQGKRIFDSTIERIWFRRSPLIRREVMKLLGS